jgi:hypothetical protein
MSHQVLEGEWEEILRHGDELSGKRVRLIVIEAEDEGTSRPNEAMLAAIQAVATIQTGMRLTSTEDSGQLLREARNGRMYGLDPAE